jgi:putative salt-induced outer membrane protein YdiY
VSYLRLLRNRWYVPGTVMLERNTDLGLDLRTSLGGGFGRYFVQTNRSLLRAGAGLVVNEENPVEGESTGNIEASLAASYSFFTYDYPKTNISTTFVLFPSLNVGGRYRTQLDVSLSREIITNFTVGVTAYDTYDSKPPAGSSSTHDFGVTLSVGWTF